MSIQLNAQERIGVLRQRSAISGASSTVSVGKLRWANHLIKQLQTMHDTANVALEEINRALPDEVVEDQESHEFHFVFPFWDFFNDVDKVQLRVKKRKIMPI